MVPAVFVFRFAGFALAASIAAQTCWAQDRPAAGIQQPQQPSPDATRPKTDSDAKGILLTTGVVSMALLYKSRQENEQLKKQLADLQRNMDASAREKQQLADRVASDANQIAQQADRIKQQQADFKQYQAEAERLQNDLVQERSVSQRLRNQLRDKEGQVDTLTSDRNRLQTLLPGLEQRVAPLEREIERLRDRLWLWVAAASLAALAFGALTVRRYWPRRIEMPLSATATLGHWLATASPGATERVPTFGVEVRVVPLRTEVMAVRPLLVKAQTA